MTFISHAQNLEDVMLWRALGRVVGDAGFYVDVGAGDPREHSVTLAFYERGWRGVNLEPEPEVFATLAAARPRDVNLRVAAGAVTEERRFFAIGGTGLSTLDPEVAESHKQAGRTVEPLPTPGVRLADVLDAHADGDVHFLKIDVEGAEAEVLAGADFTRHRPWIVLVEATRPGSTEQTHAEWETGLFGAGYVFVYFDGLNRFYAAVERVAALRPAFAAPPNPFDLYVSLTNLSDGIDLYEAGGLAPSDVPSGLTRASAGLRAALDLQRTATAKLREELAAERESLAGLRAEMETRRVATAALQGELNQERDAVVALRGELESERTVSSGLRAELQIERTPIPRPVSRPLAVRTLGRHLARKAYLLVRPVARPIAWRIRGFMVADLQRSLDAIEANARIARFGTSQGVVAPARPSLPSEGELRRLATVVEEAMLTLATLDGVAGRGPDRRVFQGAAGGERET